MQEDPNAVKACTRCGEVLPLTRFSKSYEPWGDGRRAQCKACRGARVKARRAEDAEAINAAARERYAVDPTRRARAQAQAARWRKENPERHREQTIAWRAANPEKQREQSRKKYAQRRAAGVPTHHPRLVLERRALYEAAGGVCALCAEPLVWAESTIDHIVPIARGGRHTPDNLQIAHAACNARKHDR